MGKLTDWLTDQYGPEKRFKSARQLSLAISAGRNPNLVFDIEHRGTAKIETLNKLAEALEISTRQLFELVGYIDPGDVNGTVLTLDEEELLTVYRRTPEAHRSMLRRLLETAAAYETD